MNIEWEWEWEFIRNISANILTMSESVSSGLPSERRDSDENIRPYESAVVVSRSFTSID